jgi:hypothetical protein
MIMGEMADDHSWYDPDPSDFDDPYSRGRSITCYRCNQTRLEWGHDGRGWYLIDTNGYPHRCLRPTAQEDFA